LMSVNASSSSGSIAYGYAGIIYAAQNGADIVSLSWGGFSSSHALQDVIDFAVSQGTCVIGAAGNNNSNRPFFPAAYNGVVAVANVWGTDLNASLDDQRYGTGSASNYGGWIDVAAAGVSMLSTQDFDTTNWYGRQTGTSMSAPVAAGVAALIVAQNPTWGPLKVGEQLRVSAVTGEGLAALEALLIERAGALAGAGQDALVTNARQRDALVECRDAMIAASEENDPVLRAESLRVAMRALGRLTGRVGVEDILDIVFGRFCIGK
ncbi:S8 family serine peptidase, partial [Sphingosinicella sp.]|uniref:S8 family serine peptidase n=1 Tax=Sphingosinicella sp. TaxID=1917971 RepID=UPI00260FD91D